MDGISSVECGPLFQLLEKLYLLRAFGVEALFWQWLDMAEGKGRIRMVFGSVYNVCFEVWSEDDSQHNNYISHITGSWPEVEYKQIIHSSNLPLLNTHVNISNCPNGCKRSQ